MKKSAKSTQCKARENGESSSQALFAAAFERPARAGGLSPIMGNIRYPDFRGKLGWYREAMLSPLSQPKKYNSGSDYIDLD